MYTGNKGKVQYLQLNLYMYLSILTIIYIDKFILYQLEGRQYHMDFSIDLHPYP